MIINKVIFLYGLIFNYIGTPSNSIYKYSGHFHYEDTLDTQILNISNSQYVPYIIPTFSFDCDVLYDNSSSYRLYNINFNITLDYYLLYNNQSSYEGHLDLSYNTDWEFTPSSYNGELGRLEFGFKNDIDDYGAVLIAYYDSSNDSIVCGRWFDDSPNVMFDNVSYYSNYSLNGPSIISTIESRLNNEYQEGYDIGRAEGYTEGLTDGMDTNGEAFVIFNGILSVAMIPINVFLKIFEFEVFGINISSLVSAILSVAILIIVIRLVTGKKQGD